MTAIAPLVVPSHEIDLDIQRIVLDVVGRKVTGLDTRIDNAIIDGELERTIDGASTLTVVLHDPKRALLQSGIFSQAVEVTLDRLHFRLVKVSKSEDSLTLTFEDREVAYLREITTPKKASRSKMTRAEFAYSLVREVTKGGGIRFVCPELHVKQPIEKDAQARTPAKRTVARDPGLPAKTADLMIRDASGNTYKANASQIRNAEAVLDVADSLGATPKATLALMQAVMVESEVRNLSFGDADSRGILQVRDSTAKPMRLDNRDIAACANAFLTRGFWGKGGALELERKHPDWTAGEIAQNTQGSDFPDRYNKVTVEAEGFVDAYGGGGGGGGSGATTTTTTTRVVKLPYQYRRGDADGTKENTWQALQRLAEEVNWRCFMVAGAVYFISEPQLMKAKPTFVVTETSPGVASIDFDIDRGKVRDEATIRCRASRWFAAPGAVVMLSGVGPASGRWLVANLRRGLFNADAEVTLKRPTAPTPEEAADTKTTTTTTTAGGAAGSAAGMFGADTPPEVVAAYETAQSITGHRYPYVWGGGHSAAGVPDHGQKHTAEIGYDCSGAVSAVLAAAGLGLSQGGAAKDSNALMGWGASGPGKYLTVYTRPGTTDGHAFIVFHTTKGDVHFGTGDWGKGWSGAGINKSLHPTAGFTARHFSGT